MSLIPLIQGTIPGNSMDINFHCQGTRGSLWMTEYFEHKLAILERYLPTQARIDIELEKAHARLDICTHKHEYVFEHEGADRFEAFMDALEEARRFLRQDHQKLIERVHRKLSEDALYLER